jgi:hypothetical protein
LVVPDNDNIDVVLNFCSEKNRNLAFTDWVLTYLIGAEMDRPAERRTPSLRSSKLVVAQHVVP